MSRRLATGLVLTLLVAACGDGGTIPSSSPVALNSTMVSVTTTTVAVDRVGGAEFIGTFETGPGFGPGVITFLLDDTGDKIVVITLIPGLNGLNCPNGVTVSGGGYDYWGSFWIDDDDSFSMSLGLSGVFDSATEAHGTYDLQYEYNCAYVLDWTATSQTTVATPTTAAATPTTMVSASAIPISGTWQGTIGSLDSDFTDDLTLVLQEDCRVDGICGTFHAAGGNCRGDLQLLDATHPTYVFREILRSGGQYCIDGGMETLTLEDPETLSYHFEYHSEDGFIESVGTLTLADWDDDLPSYSEVVATYPAGTELCTTHAGISGGGDGYSLGGYDGQGATIQIRNGETLAWCFGAKYVVTGPMVDEDGEPIPVGALLTLDTEFQFVQVSSFG